MTDVPPPAAGPAGQLQTLLTAGETLLAHALQHRLYALIHRREVAAATSTRFIHLTRPLLGGYRPTDIRWQDLKEAQITVGLFTATLTLGYYAGRADTAAADTEGPVTTLRCASLTIPEAQALYRECQGQELAWREKRRVRAMEEARASSGGVQIATGVYGQGAGMGGEEPPRLTGAGEEPVERLARAKAMHTQGLITDAEYEAIKARVVGGL